MFGVFGMRSALLACANEIVAVVITLRNTAALKIIIALLQSNTRDPIAPRLQISGPGKFICEVNAAMAAAFPKKDPCERS